VDRDMETKPKVIIAVPVADAGYMKVLTAHAIGCTIIQYPELIKDYIVRVSCDIVSSRTWLVNEAIKNGGTHILFVDSDMQFMMSALGKLLAHDKEIVGTEYNKRQFPLEGVFKPMTERSETDLYEAKYAGMGLMLIKLSIFDKEWVDPINGKKVPYFNFGRDSKGNLAMGEDCWFSNAARDMGFKTYIDPTIKVRHLGEYAY
jgi:hypothetical protein